MTNKRVYDKRKALLLQDSTICRENRRIFDEFFVYEEYKLKRINGLNALDEATYKTLLEYCSVPGKQSRSFMFVVLSSTAGFPIARGVPTWRHGARTGTRHKKISA